MTFRAEMRRRVPPARATPDPRRWCPACARDVRYISNPVSVYCAECGAEASLYRPGQVPPDGRKPPRGTSDAALASVRDITTRVRIPGRGSRKRDLKVRFVS